MRKLEIDLFRFVRMATCAEIFSIFPDLTEDYFKKEPPRGDVDGHVSIATLARMGEVICPEPPTDPNDTACWSRETRAVVLAERLDKGFSLWHPKDFVNMDWASDDGEQFFRPVFRLADYKRAGCPKDEAGKEPLSNGADQVGRVHLRGEQPATDSGPVARVLTDPHQIRKPSGRALKLRKEA